MRLSTRLITLAITAVALSGALGAQQRNDNRSAPRREEPRAQAPRGHTENRGRQDVRPQQYASSRAETRGGNGYAARPDPRGGHGYQPRNDPRDRPGMGNGNDFRGDGGRRVPVAEHGRPLITRGYGRARGYDRPSEDREERFENVGFNRWGGRLALPFGWGNRIVVRGYFPVSYVSYCEAVPAEYEYMLPEMRPDYDSCLFGDRVVVIDRFSRGIVFALALR